MSSLEPKTYTSTLCGRSKGVFVTGIVNELSPKYSYLHSWVEVEREGQKIVFDPVKNVVMSKKNYDMLFDAKELERIDGKTLYDEQDVYWDLVAVDDWYSKLYLCSRQEAIAKWKELGLDKMSKQERQAFHDEQVKRRAKEKELKNSNTSENIEQK